MTIQTIRDFAPADRYRYDFGPCSYTNGFAQFDTRQDASYYGVWVSPTRRAIVSYCEGDVTMQVADTDEEFVQIVREFVRWNDAADYGPAKIDCLSRRDEAIAARFRMVGLVDLLH